MTWKKTVQDPEKLMEYRRPLFIASAFASNWSYLELMNSGPSPTGNPALYIGKGIESMVGSLLPALKLRDFKLPQIGAMNIDKSDQSTNTAPEEQKKAPAAKQVPLSKKASRAVKKALRSLKL